MKEEILQKHFEAYKRRASKWTFPASNRRLFLDFNDLEEQKAIIHLEQKKEVFEFIYNKLETDSEKMFLKSDFFDHLEYLKNAQRIKKFSLLIENFISQIKDSNISETFCKTDSIEKNKRTSTAKMYAITYILDCQATKTKPLDGQKKELIEFLSKNYKDENPKPSTIYKNFNSVSNIDFTKENNLIDELGMDWRNVVLSLSRDKEALQKHIEESFKLV